MLREQIRESPISAKIPEFARLEARLLENLDISAELGETESLVRSRSRIVDELDRFAQQVLKKAFTDLSRTGRKRKDTRIARLTREGRYNNVPEATDGG